MYCVLYPYLRQLRYWWRKPAESKSIPLVSGCWPIVGHGLAFSGDEMGFIERCYKIYGPIFRLQVFRSEMIVVCDRSLLKQYFRERESTFSLYDALRRIYFGEAFSESSSALETIISVVKSTVRVKYDTFAPKIVDEAQKMTQRLRQRLSDNPEKIFQVKEELIRFVARTSARCFICIDLSEEFFDVLMQFTDLLNRLVVLTYFAPRWLIKITLGRRLDKLRNQMTAVLSSEIDLYRNDLQKTDSLVFRKAVDYRKEDGTALSNREIGEVVVCLLYVSSENTALGLNNVLIDLVQKPEFGEKLANQVRSAVERNDFKSVFSNKLMDACVMESARLNTHIFPLNRRSRNTGAMLGDYFVDDAPCVALCEPMLMKHKECAADIFNNPSEFNPDRFLIGGETYKPQQVMTWGAGTHLCPGKNFAIYEIKAALALLLNTFEFTPECVGKLQYFSPSAYAERQFDSRLKLLSNPVIVGDTKLLPNQAFIRSTSGDRFVCEVLTDEKGEKLYLIRDRISPETQRRMFLQTVARCGETECFKQLVYDDSVPDKQAWPIGYESLIYTGTSNVAEMKEWKNIATAVWCELAKSLGEPFLCEKKFNSVYTQMYHASSEMSPHCDQYVDWGVSVSLGASCKFHYGTGDKSVVLNSGDVLLCDFSRIRHSVGAILTEDLPPFVNIDVVQNDDSVDKAVKQLVCERGRIRCSIQIRDTHSCLHPNPLKTDEEFLAMLRA